MSCPALPLLRIKEGPLYDISLRRSSANAGSERQFEAENLEEHASSVHLLSTGLRNRDIMIGPPKVMADAIRNRRQWC
jgi:hypothetical protein